MARLARAILPNYPHHVIQRGNRGQDVFFCNEDYQVFLDLLKEWCHQEDVEVWAYCLMTNHVHFILKPGKDSNLSRAIGETHRRYTCMITTEKNGGVTYGKAVFHLFQWKKAGF
jgi:REP-associated tyrosine transposase